ncbi:MAG: hypothetical protein VKS61_11550 [Candidatus Sericytochromatia bacterium]|nr:hypothetical protein [Candidatus Sericytochromatia bacterium]
MRTCQTLLALVLVAASLAGCGKNPTASVPAEQRTRFGAGVKAKAVPSPAAVAPKESTYLSAPPASVTTRPGAKASAAPAAPAAPVQKLGAVRLKVRTFGPAAVGSLVLNVISHADPSLAAMVPLAMNGAEADWETEDLVPGMYDMILEVRDVAGQRIGSGKAVAEVVAGEIAAVAVDITVQPPASATPAPGNGGSAGGGTAATETPTPVPTSPASATPAPVAGGTLGIRVEFL